MKLNKFFSSAAVVILAGSLLASCTKTAEPNVSGSAQPTTAGKKDAVINSYMNGEIPTIDPGLSKSSNSSWVLDHSLEGLYFQDKDGLKEGQAKDVKISSDGLVYTFTLKDNLKWSNNDPVTAHDFEFAWKRVLDPVFASEYAYQIGDYTKGGTEYNKADPKKLSPDEMKKLRDAVGVKAKDDKTLEVTLANATPYFKQLVSFYTYYPVNKKVVEANPKWAFEASMYVGNGPFKVTEWAKDKKLVLTKSDTYYDKDKITTKQIVFNNITDDLTAWQLYTNGDLNYYMAVLPEGIEAAKKSGELKINPKLATYFYRFNVTKAPFNNLKVRQAFSMAIDRKAIIDNITKGEQTPAFGFVSGGIKQDSDKKDFREVGGNAFFKEDVAQAKTLLAEGLKELNMTTIPPITLTFNTNAGHQKIATAIQEMWKKNLGVEVKIENVESKVWLDRQHALDFQIMRAGWIGDYLDPMTFIDMFVTNGGNNETGYSNPKYDELVQAAKKEQDSKKREQQLHDAEKILMADLPIMPIYYYTSVDAAKPNISGYYVPANRNAIFRYVTSK